MIPVRGWVLIAIGIVLILVAQAQLAVLHPAEVTTDPRMPSVSGYALLNEGYVGSLSCGHVYLEVRHGANKNEFVSVWFLNKRVPARGKIVFITFSYDKYAQTFIDVNMDGLWDSVKITMTANGEYLSSSDVLKMVKGCGDGWFR